MSLLGWGRGARAASRRWPRTGASSNWAAARSRTSPSGSASSTSTSRWSTPPSSLPPCGASPTGTRGRPGRPSALHVGQLLGDLAVAYAEDVHAPDVAAGPGVGPQLHDPIVGGQRLVDLEMGAPVVEDRLPRRADGRAAHVPNPVRCR